MISGSKKKISFSVTEADDRRRNVKMTKTLNVKIPAGVSQGTMIRLQGQGGKGIGGAENGDLFLEIDLAPHPFFTVSNRDIFLDLPLSPWEAAIGADITVPTLYGKVTLTVVGGSNNGKKLRIKGKGLPGSPPGDQIVVLRIDLPKTHSEKAKALYRKLAKIERFNPREKLGV